MVGRTHGLDVTAGIKDETNNASATTLGKNRQVAGVTSKATKSNKKPVMYRAIFGFMTCLAPRSSAQSADERQGKRRSAQSD